MIENLMRSFRYGFIDTYLIVGIVEIAGVLRGIFNEHMVS